ncbi:MAG: hypothetical protein RR415_08850 [Ruthenibacterium sp.]
MTNSFKKQTFIVLMETLLSLHDRIDELDKIGFDIERGVARQMCGDEDKLQERINALFKLQEASDGYTLVDWWAENKRMKQDSTFIENDVPREIRSVSELWEIVKHEVEK